MLFKCYGILTVISKKRLFQLSGNGLGQILVKKNIRYQADDFKSQTHVSSTKHSNSSTTVFFADFNILRYVE